PHLLHRPFPTRRSPDLGPLTAQVKTPDMLKLMDARAFLESLSERQRVQFREANVRIGNGRTVHAATTIEWYGGVPLVVPACRVGISGWWLDRLHPSYGPVTCGRAACRASAGAPRWAPRHASVRSEERRVGKEGRE